MISYESILSMYNKKMTLLQYLKKVEEALKSDGLKSVEISYVDKFHIQFKFIFFDDSELVTEPLELENLVDFQNQLDALTARVYRLEANVFVKQTDTSVMYIKTVPSNSLEYAILDSVGGMSYKCEQLLNISDVAETTINGVTYSVKDGVVTLNGTATSSFNLLLFEIDNLTIGTTYTYNGFVTNSNPFNNLRLSRDGNTTYVTTLTYQSGDVVRLQAFINSGSTFNNAIAKPMLVSGSTAPTKWQPYFDFEGIRDSAVTSVVGAETKVIPSEVQALEGYGWGINDTCYNYIDYERKVFVQKVGRVDLGTLTFTKTALWYESVVSNLKYVTSNTQLGNAIATNYTIRIAQGMSSASAYELAIDTANIKIKTDDSLEESPSGYLYYELATPVETDISQYIDDGYINVEGGGTITFNNEYEQDVPSVVTYLVKGE
jgi:hypothetical protein